MPIAMKRRLHKERMAAEEAAHKQQVEATPMDDSDSDDISDDGEDLMAQAAAYSDEDMASSMDDDDDNEGDESMSDAASDDEEDDEEQQQSANDGHAKAPSNEEIQSLQDTIDEMLGEVRINYSKAGTLEHALRQMKTVLDHHLEHDGYTLHDAIRRLDRDQVKIPFPEPKPSDSIQYTFAWKRPSAIHLVGSYAIKAITTHRDQFNVDVAVEMPKDLFTEKDVLNYRYFHKRAYYLAEIAAAFKRASPAQLAVHLSYAYIDNDPRRPILLLTGNGKGGDTDFSAMGACIRVFPAIADSTLPT
ncbi:Nrap protein-domain-containing protein, partial [Syncephalis pseudoplumigaleata]